MCLILFPDSAMRSGLHSSLFFRVSGMSFLLVRPACMAVLTGLWHRLSSSLLWVCLSLFLLRMVARPGHGLGSHFMMQKRPVPGSSGASLAKRPHLERGNEAHPSGKKSAGGLLLLCVSSSCISSSGSVQVSGRTCQRSSLDL